MAARYRAERGEPFVDANLQVLSRCCHREGEQRGGKASNDSRRMRQSPSGSVIDGGRLPSSHAPTSFAIDAPASSSAGWPTPG